ncbi:Multiple type acyltransferase domains containing protein [Chrysochromulina ericina virus CeV-01B]|uniref:Multiple type acyltransferase domains containing protein n=1 Tax=Chrysochromulina ericina virus CeV-01B TaxID=3070830 RepID=A0A0N9QAD0_9VIRU|nr:SAM-dependent methyltransferase [Chrysochromulina ericina virus]ALH23085.1 Multiple type acyltransferase domains containing protein [Chrysochromulina ericina virus CeV-01B]
MHIQARNFTIFVKDILPFYFKNKNILDVGAGDINGNNQFLFEDCIYQANDVVEVQNITHVSKTKDLPFENNSFDTIISTECFEHDPEWEQSLKKIYEMLKPNGLFCFTCASTNRPEHGTRRTSPSCSYGTIGNLEDMQDYYKNLTQYDINNVLKLKELFSTWDIYYNYISHDLYFIGIKKCETISQNIIFKEYIENGVVNQKFSVLNNPNCLLNQSVCLNMIVKNEKHIIRETLDNLTNYITFDYWVISDTGSIDKTQEFIKDYFREKNIPGELFEDKWQDFAYNRNLAREHAFNKSDYLFFFDADDLIHGDFKLPDKLDKDVYQFKFGTGFSYDRICLINNREKIAKYLGVLHELLNVYKPNFTIELIDREYHFESRRLGDRSKNPDKYKNDAEILEKAYNTETTDLGLKYRYAYYCAQSYRDAHLIEKSIEWFKLFLDLPADNQYKYCACNYLGDSYKKLNNMEDAINYWYKAIHFDRERRETVVKIMEYYFTKDNHFAINLLYDKMKNYKLTNTNGKIFLDMTRYYHIDYFNSIASCYIDEWMSGYYSCKNLLLNDKCVEITLSNFTCYAYNMNFDKDKKPFIDKLLELFEKYFDTKKELVKKLWNLVSNHINEYLPEQFCKLDNKYNEVVNDFPHKIPLEEVSNKILIYTGHMNFLWNDSTLKEQSIGGSEKAVIYLSRCLPKNYEIFIAGDQLEEEIDNIKYIHHNNLQKLLNENNFHTIIVSRYVSFFEKYNNYKCYQLLLSAHDSTGFINFTHTSIDNILSNKNKIIDYVICLTEWHKNNIIERHSYLKDKIRVINNGINLLDFNKENISLDIKVKNKFVWTSCAYRGLQILLDLWPKILEKLPDATLDISSYDTFPKNQDEEKMLEIINMHSSITHHGKLNTQELYKLANESEYWLYTNTFPETSCITAMEMLMCGVITLYYPLAGLNDTIGEYGIKVERGNEIESILNLSRERKTGLRKKGKEYALSCSWENRAEEWSSLLGLNRKKWIFYCSPHFETKMIQQYIDNLNYVYPEHNIHLTNDKNRILTENPSKITFVYEIFYNEIIKSLPNTQFSFLNTEPLNIPVRLEHTINILKLYPNLEYYDYSQSNLKILQENEINIKDKIYLPYKCSDEELEKLINLNKNTKKEFDFGILKTMGGVMTERREKIVNFLKKHNFTVNIIGGWADDRDMELAKCKIILNIHGNLSTTISYIFEHIRCDRLLESGFNILSETSYKLNIEFINKNPNLKFIDYNEFFNIAQIIEYYNNKLGSLAHNNYVLNILQDTHTRINIPNEHINFLEKLSKDFYPENMIIYDIGSSVLHWTQNANKIWKNSKIYLFDGMTEMKLFYDEYNKQNNTNYEYNVGVLCDEDYKRISFYQNDELSGGNSYYKEIGHPNSSKIFTENHIKHKIGMRLETIVKNKNIPIPDLIKIDVQGAELDILKGSMSIINKAKFLIVELQHTEYNQGAPLCNQTRDFLIENGWQVYAEKFSNNGPDADWCFINTQRSDLMYKQQPKIIDCFIFYNELDLLTYRLNILNDVVDYFVLVESTHTFVGKEKPLFYQENKQLFEKFNHKIIHIIVDDFPHKYPNIDFEKKEQWNNEKFQRNCISRGIDKLELNNQDIIIIADVDEIPKIELLENIKYNKMNINEVKALQMDFYYYNLHSKLDHYTDVTRILPYYIYQNINMTIDDLRFKYYKNFINNAGWHLSYFGDENFIKNKIENFAHQELNINLFTNQEKIQNRIKNTQDLFDRPTKLIHINIEDNDNLPPYYDIYLTNFYKK